MGVEERLGEQERIQAILNGDTQACHALVMQHLPSLYAYFQGMGLSASFAEDLAQETFLECWRSLSAFRGESSFKTWLFVIARRVSWRQIKRSRRHDPDEEISESNEQAETPKQHELLWRREQKELLQEAIALMDSRFREVLLLHYMEDMSIREVAMVLDVAEGTVKSRLNRGLSQLRGKLESRWTEGEH